MSLKEEMKALKAVFDGQALYTPEFLEHCESTEQKMKSLKEPTHLLDKFVTFHANGEPEQIDKVEGFNKVMKLTSYHQMICTSQQQGSYIKDFRGKDVIVKIGDEEPSQVPKKAEECCLNEKSSNFNEWGRIWLETDVARNIRRFLRENAKNMRPVKKIVCIGLGRLDPLGDYVNMSDHAGRSYLQHVAINMIRHTLEQEQSNSKEFIETYAQDPSYCSNCKEILQDRFGMKIIESAVSAFRMIEEDTFVMSICPTIPVRQIVGDLIDFTGKQPAGLFCEDIYEDGIGIDGRADPSSPRIYRYACDKKVKSMDIEDEQERFDVPSNTGGPTKQAGGSVFGPATMRLYLTMK